MHRVWWLLLTENEQTMANFCRKDSIEGNFISAKKGSGAEICLHIGVNDTERIQCQQRADNRGFRLRNQKSNKPHWQPKNMGKLKVKVDSAVFQGNGKKCHVEFRLDSKVLAKTNPINTNKKVQETSFNESHTIDINESDELIVGTSTPIFLLRLTLSFRIGWLWCLPI